ncbi:MAG TPA: hypothetical protein VGN00_26155 [Puia sp.]|jgi:hypothetical protein
MKHSEKELNVDYIGGLGPLTKEDEKAISAFIQAQKLKKDKRKTRLSSRKKVQKRDKVKA